jgi:hypothetical protein
MLTVQKLNRDIIKIFNFYLKDPPILLVLTKDREN